ncbi:hypothetical protein BMS3Bbin04_00398 [bacterium BMS3Bbin04]|nr:hypothetical protein BMS3Bbin04_00398 [bacterium BMS3Bbin04]
MNDILFLFSAFHFGRRFLLESFPEFGEWLDEDGTPSALMTD